MEKPKQKAIIGTVSLEEALNLFANSSDENRDLLKRIQKINEMIAIVVDERKNLGLTQRDISNLTGIKQPMIARFEKAEMMPRIDTFLRLISCLDLDLNLIHKNEYSELNFNQKFSYKNNKYIGEEYAFTKSEECVYQA